eukprot:Colp12_sorted_trinity150504_noHs@9540
MCGEPKVVSLMLECLKKHWRNPVIAEVSIGLLIKGSSSVKDTDAFGKQCCDQGILNTLFACMKRHFDKDTVVEKCAWLLWHLDQVCKQCVDAGGIPLLVDCTKRHMASEYTVQRCTYALTVLSNAGDGKQQYLNLGAVQLLLDCLRQHAGSAEAVAHGALMVENLLDVFDTEQQVRVVEAGGVAVLLECLKRNIDSFEVAENCTSQQTLNPAQDLLK